MERSYWWTTSDPAVGDGAVSYTQADLSVIAKILAACCGFEGVASGYLNQLAPTANGANTVAVNTDGGLVDGKPYHNTASVDVNVPSAAGAGNTRIDRIVLRAGWAAQTVRITRIAGTDAASPTAPALTQTSGTTYDISLCTVLVTTAGVVTVTDTRTMAAVGTTGVATGAVTEAKIGTGAVTSAKVGANAVTAGKLADGAVDTAARLANDIVDDTKVGNRVPALTRRQGGSATDWGTVGETTYTPGAVRIQAGRFAATGTGETITFPVAFSYSPLVFITTDAPPYPGAVWYTTATAFNAIGLSDGINVMWLAIGPE